MKSSRSRSRSKNNRNRGGGGGGGNVVNRVFDSSGPEGKVRGTPQQIIDKYNQLARDAQLSGDRVATENFQQHAEHYLRLLSEAQREMDSKREEQERQNRERQAERDRDRSARQENDSNADPAQAPQPEVADVAAVVEPVADSGLVETPESQPKPKPTRSRSPRKPKAPKADAPKADAPAGDAPETPASDSGSAPEAAE